MNIYKKMASYKQLTHHKDEKISKQWMTGGEHEFGRLFMGFKPNDVERLDMLEWKQKIAVPKYKTVMYPRYTTAARPEKDKKYWVRITAGGDRIDYEGDVSTHTASMETIKTHWNSVISTPNAKYCTGDISNMYLMSNLFNSEYVKFKVDMIPPCIIAHYKLEYIYAKINKSWYWLKQAGRITHNDLVQHLKKYRFVQAKKPDGLFTQILRHISFALAVDDFWIKYTNKQDCDYLIKIMRDKYKLKVDYETKQYIGIHLK